MGNFQSGAKARLIFNGSALRAACLIKFNRRHMDSDIAPFSKEVINAF